MSGILTDIKRQTMDWMSQLLVWDHAQKQQIVRAGFAAAHGLNPDQYVRPFPGTSVVPVPIPVPAQPASATASASADAAQAATPPAAWQSPRAGTVAAGPSLAARLAPYLVTAGIGLATGGGGLGLGYLLTRPVATPATQPSIATPVVDPQKNWQLKIVPPG